LNDVDSKKITNHKQYMHSSHTNRNANLCKAYRPNACLRFAVLLCILFTSYIASAQNWNVARGGNALHNCLTSQFGPVDETLLWSGGLFSTIAQAPVSDSIYLAIVRMSNITDFIDGSRIVMMDIRTGNTLWMQNLPVDFPATDWFNKISAIHKGVLYVSRSGNSNQSYLYALNAFDGSVIWRSESLIDESSSEGALILPNGDLVIGNRLTMLRINKVDGSTIWQTNRLAYENGAELLFYGSKIYGIVNDQGDVKIAAFDTSNGQLLYTSAAIDAGLFQQVGIFAGADGTLYLPRSQNNPTTDFMYSFTDSGSGFALNWNVPIGYIPFSSSGVGSDGSVYTYSRSGKVIRINPISGETIDSSMVVLFGDASSPRMSIDAVGRVYVSNGGFSDGNFYWFNADLSLRWQETLESIFIGGPIIGWQGSLVLCGTGNTIKVYKGDPAATIEVKEADASGLSAFPNPTANKVVLNVNARFINAPYCVYNIMGKMLLSGTLTSEYTMLDLQAYPPGSYICVVANDLRNAVKVVKE
jgi:outer membrane protein assembly factor BamB